MRRATLSLLTLAQILALAACGDSLPETAREASASAQSDPPDVVVVMIDTLRPDHLGLYGYERETAPFLAELAASSTVFRRAWSTSSWTAPATASLFTSAYPTHHGVTRGFFATRDVQDSVTGGETAKISIPRLPENRLTMPELFRDAGYRTFGLAANVNIGEEIGFDRGFDRFERLHDLTEGSSSDAPDLERRLLEWQDEIDAADSAFVYLHFNDVHNPYRRNAPWYERQDDPLDDARARYDSEIRVVDESLRRLFEHLGWLGDDTIVAVVSDHGEEFREHGGRFHRPSLYRELMQVVTLVRAPGGISHSANPVDANVSLVDLLPTLLDLAGLPPAEGLDGISLAPLVNGESDSVEPALDVRAIYAHRQGARRSHGLGDEILESVVLDDLHLIRRSGPSDSVELFDLATDPGEQVDLAASRPEDTARLLDLLGHFASSETMPEPSTETSEVEVDAEAIERLKILGYIE